MTIADNETDLERNNEEQTNINNHTLHRLLSSSTFTNIYSMKTNHVHGPSCGHSCHGSEDHPTAEENGLDGSIGE